MAKYAAFGTTLYRGTSGAGTAIAQVDAIGGPDLSADTEDVTSHDSTNAWEEVVVTILRSGELSLDIVYDPANATHVQLWTDMVSRASTTYTLVFPDAASTEWAFAAFVTGFGPTANHDGRLESSVTMKLTGDITLA